jgi:hypothetical protein
MNLNRPFNTHPPDIKETKVLLRRKTRSLEGKCYNNQGGIHLSSLFLTLKSGPGM